ncbi:cellulose binding domain-containing protein [Plantactinospora sp. CA-294935]|uniref:cellulose binding domain-containing protein n=1 Tax=Plantactinospora sp. CA-294935 TaxID=3240012 RepID=UPI003D89F1E2
MRRRTFLKVSTAAAATAGGVALLGAWQANAAPVGALGTAPTTPFAVGVRQYNWTRGSRPCTTYVYYPATGNPGGNPVTNAPVAAGIFPVYNFTHGYQSSPQNSLFIIRVLAAAGFVVPAPHFEHNFDDVNNGNTSRDVSEILTRTLALNGSGPLAGHIDTSIGVGVSGHSLGGMTTHGLLTSWPDSRIISANPQSCVDMGNPASSVRAKVLFVHGDRDDLTQYSSARQAYAELPAPKAFLTFVGGSHTSFWSDNRFPATVVDWARWTMYGDTAARDRLPADASGSGTRWEFVPGADPTTGPTTPPVTTPSPTTSAPGGAVSATYQITNTWPGGFQAEVTVSAGSLPINGWTARWTLASGQAISQVWNGTLNISGSAVTVRNASYNGSLAANTSTTFGFVASGSPSTAALTVTTP